ALQLPIALESPALESSISQGRLDRASRLGDVRAVVEPAPQGERLDVLEDAAQCILSLPELGLAQPRGVDDHAAARQLDQLPVAGHVASLARAVDASGLHDLG